MRRYLSFSAALHAAAFALLALYARWTAMPTVYSGFELIGGQSGFGTGRLEPAPAPAAPAPAAPAPSDEPPIEAPKPSDNKDQLAVPVPEKTGKDAKSAPTKGKDPEGKLPPNKKGKGQVGGRGDSPLGKGDIQGSKTGPVGGVGTSLEIGGFGPGGGGKSGAHFPYAWYVNTIYRRLWQSWDRRDAGDRECTVIFAIRRDGGLKSVDVKKSSGDALFDLVAKRAVETSAPFPPLPGGFKDDVLRVFVRFRLQ